MARAIAIKEINQADGVVHVVWSDAYATSGTPADPGPTNGYIWGSLQELQDDIVRLAQSMDTQQLALIHLAMTWLQPNGSFGNVNQVLNKRMIFDPGAAQPWRIV